jgi:hypothetical protein
VRNLILAIVAIGLGLAIALVDSRPSWDDTGITAVALLLVAGVVAALAGRRPWLWALLVGAWTPLVELANGQGSGAILALGFAVVGASAGYALSGRWRGRRRDQA